MPRITKKQREEIVASEVILLRMKFRDERREYERNSGKELFTTDKGKKYWIYNKIDKETYVDGVDEIIEREYREIHELYLIHKIPSPYQYKYNIIDNEGMEAWNQYCREH